MVHQKFLRLGLSLKCLYGNSSKYFYKAFCRNQLPQVRQDNLILSSTSKYSTLIQSKIKTKSDVEAEEEEARQKIENMSPTEKRRLQIIQLEYDVLVSNGHRVAQNVTNCQWLELLNEYPSPHQRMKALKFWGTNELKQANADRLKEEKKKVMQEMEQKWEEQGKEYGNKIFMFIRDTTMRKHYYNNLAHAMVFGQPLVLDFDFDRHMTPREIKSLLKQLMELHALNKVHKEPFHLVFANMKPEHQTVQRMNNIGTWGELPYTYTDKSYLDLYPKEKLVYLSPNSPTTLKSFSHDDIYIIGALVDRAAEPPLTFSKSKKEGLRSAKLPLDNYLSWQIGSKALNLEAVMGILLDIKSNSSWKKALEKYIPKRKITQRNVGQNVKYGKKR